MFITLFYVKSVCTPVDNYVSLALSLSLYIYIYIHVCVCVRLRVGRPKNRGSIPVITRDISLVRSVHPLWGHPVSYSVGTGVSVIVVTEAGA